MKHQKNYTLFVIYICITFIILIQERKRFIILVVKVLLERVSKYPTSKRKIYMIFSVFFFLKIDFLSIFENI